jgi:thiol-disulfide isomerase/thioredoxin
MGLKGEIPECIGDLGDMISYFAISDEPGLTGSLPGSFANLVALESIGISRTSIQFVPDVFTGMPLVSVDFQQNEELFCPLPYSLGDSPALVYLHLHSNRFTGELPASWARLGEGLKVYNNCLTGKIPQEYIEAGLSDEFYSQLLWQRGGYGFDVTDIDIPGRWNNCYVKGEMKDLKGETFTFDDVIKKNKYTVFLNWAPWCPFSKDLMPALRDYYEKYRQDGLEVIATVMFSQNGAHWSDMEGQVKEVEEKGYGQWYNFYFDPELKLTYVMHTPAAEIYDSDGNIVFSSFHSYIDPVRKRFGKTASSDLIPFLETVFGPAEAPDPYTSTDYSKDGEVLTLQKATVGKGIDIVFMGDAYTDRDMDAGGLYETVMKEAMEEFFGIEPYRTFRDRFNVYAVKVVSPNGRIGADYTTALGVTFGAGTSVRGNDGKAFEYAMKVPSITDKENLLVCVMMNTRRHAGTAALHSTLQSGVAYTSTYANDRSLFGPTLRHEAGGHGFAFLADEYSTHNQSAPAEHIAYYNEVFEKYGWYSNVDFTDDPSKIRWSAFLSDERYKDEVGIFEGGALYSKGAYRPSKNGMMNESMEYHNAPSRWAIYRQIMKRSGEECSFEKFLEYDAVNRGKAAAAPRPPLKAAAAPKRRFEPTAPPVILP